MKQVVFLFAALSLTSLLGCASTQPPANGPSAKEAAAMQELNRKQSESAQPAPSQRPRSRRSKK